MAVLHRAWLCIGLLLALGACVATKGFQAADYHMPMDRPVTLLVVEPDVEVGLLTAGGLVEPNREWTAQAKASLLAAIRANQAARGIAIVEVKPEALGPEAAALLVDYEKLHRAVGSMIARHKYGSETLPTKKRRFDWTLGPGAAQVGQAAGGNYALFLFARDSFASTGRVVLQVVVALLGAGVPSGGQRFAYASLVDLSTGDVVWFNVLASGVGDMRSPDGARATIDTLFKTMPKTATEQAVAVKR